MALRDYLVQEVALDCEDGLLSRREALRRLGLLGVTGAAAVALLAACGDDDDAASTTRGGHDADNCCVDHHCVDAGGERPGVVPALVGQRFFDR